MRGWRCDRRIGPHGHRRQPTAGQPQALVKIEHGAPASSSTCAPGGGRRHVHASACTYRSMACRQRLFAALDMLYASTRRQRPMVPADTGTGDGRADLGAVGCRFAAHCRPRRSVTLVGAATLVKYSLTPRAACSTWSRRRPRACWVGSGPPSLAPSCSPLTRSPLCRCVGALPQIARFPGLGDFGPGAPRKTWVERRKANLSSWQLSL